MGGNVRRVNRAFVIRRDAGRSCPAGQAVRVRRIRNERLQRSVQGVADHDAPDLTSLGCRIGESRAHIDGVVLAHEHGARLAELLPRGDEVAVLIEDLDALVLAIGDIDAVLRAAEEDVVRFVEIAGRGASFSPALDEFSILRKFQHAAVVVRIGQVAVGHEDIAGRPIERIRTVSGHALSAERHQHLAVGGELQHLLTHHHACCVPGRHAKHHLSVIDVGCP